MTRQNRKGDPWPRWCATDHDADDSMHCTTRVAIDLPGHMGHVSALAGLFGRTDAEVVVHATWYGAPETNAADLYLSPTDAGQVAGLVEILSHATPEQHLEVAAAIREAAAAIEDGTR